MAIITVFRRSGRIFDIYQEMLELLHRLAIRLRWLRPAAMVFGCTVSWSHTESRIWWWIPPVLR